MVRVTLVWPFPISSKVAVPGWPEPFSGFRTMLVGFDSPGGSGMAVALGVVVGGTYVTGVLVVLHPARRKPVRAVRVRTLTNVRI